MRIVIIEVWFSEKMGYAENCLSKALARLGQDVHVLTSTAQVYFDQPFYRDSYESYLGPAVVQPGIKHVDGYTLHRLPYGRRGGELTITGLLPALRSLRPETVQTFDTVAPWVRDAALGRLMYRYRLFTGAHHVASVFPPAQPGHELNWKGQIVWAAKRRAPGRAISLLSERCYAVTPDAASIATRFYGVEPRKVRLSPLGVDVDLFHPAGAGEVNERAELRRSLGFGQEDIVCIFTGRFTARKNPACLASAVAALRAAGLPLRALCIGDGPQAGQLRASPGCVVRPFVPYPELPAYYRAADIGVWPMEESTSMLDAAGCGLPVVTHARLRALEHLDGNWMPYAGGDVADLARVLRLLVEPDARAAMGAAAARTIADVYSWDRIARERLCDYLRARGGSLQQ